MKTFEEAERKGLNPFYTLWWIQDHKTCQVEGFRRHFILEKADPVNQRQIFRIIRDTLIELNAIGMFQDCTLFRTNDFIRNPLYFEEPMAWEVKLELSNIGKRILQLLDTSCEILADHPPRESMWITPYYGKIREKTDTDIFVLMPFKEELKGIYEAIGKVATKLQRNCHRADDLTTYPSPEKRNEIMRNKVWPEIASARHIIADLTGLNPNVFYELGIADTIGKPITFIIDERQEMVKTPFDVTHREIHKYDRERLAEFERQLEEILKP